MLLEVVTRCHPQRETLQARCFESLDRQTCDAWTQTLIVDEQGQGLEWANHALAETADDLSGDYVWVLDDDDWCERETLVEELQEIVRLHQPDVIMLKCRTARHGVVPGAHWQHRPVFTDVAMPCFVVRREVYRRHAVSFKQERGADYQFIRDVFEAKPSIYWHDVIGAACDAQRFGAAE